MGTELRKLHDRLTYLHQLAGDALDQLVLAMEREPVTPHPQTTMPAIGRETNRAAETINEAQPLLPGTKREDVSA